MNTRKFVVFCLVTGFTLLSVSYSSCSRKLSSIHVSTLEDLEKVAAPPIEIAGPLHNRRCRDAIEYIPDSSFKAHFSLREIRVNFHIMNSQDSTNNFVGEEAIKYIGGLFRDANRKLGKNQKMNLPEGNDTKVYDPHYRYVLTPSTNEKGDDGIYFHYDDDLFYFIIKGKNKNNYKREVIKKYAVNKDSVLNIFVMPHHPDSVASSTYNAFGTGIALGSAIKIAGLYESGAENWAFSTMLNHEVGHVFGLRHTYRSEDGCDDTPRNPNCWYNSGVPPCDGIASNNMMDYNNSQLAITPCQLGSIHRNIANLTSRQRKLVIPSWCKLNEEKTIFISEKTHWKAAKDLEGHLIVKADAELKISCRVSFPQMGKLIVEPGATLILDKALLHNSCGNYWSGIELQSKGKKKAKLVVHENPTIENVTQDQNHNS
jgi:hypothetical protein